MQELYQSAFNQNAEFGGCVLCRYRLLSQYSLNQFVSFPNHDIYPLFGRA